jgi:hypothetical protein
MQGICLAETFSMLVCLHEQFLPRFRRDLLLYSDVLCTDAFWREGVARLREFTGRHLIETHRQRLNWQVGFLFCSENEAAANG